jgi:hypothetical protein
LLGLVLSGWVFRLACAPLMTSPACSGPCRCRRLYGCRLAVVGGCFCSCASWVVDLRVLGPPRRPRASPEDSPSWSGSSPPSALLRVAATRRSGERGRGCFCFLGARSAAYGTSPADTRLSDGFSGNFRFFRWSLQLVSRRAGCECLHAPVAHRFAWLHAPLFFFFFFLL